MTPPDVTLMVAAFRARLLPPLPLTALGFGGVLDGLEPPDIAPLFDALVADHEAGWEIAVDLMGMYAFQNRERFDGLRPQVVRLADEVSRRPPMLRLPATITISIRSWAGCWHAAERITTPVPLRWPWREGWWARTRSRTPSPYRRLLPTLLADFPEVVWPLIGQAIVSDRWKAHRLGLALGDSFSFGPRTNPPLLHLPEATLFAWCHAHPDSAPAFAAGLLPVLAAPDGEERKVSFHPRLARLLDEFGDREDVREAIDRNVNSFGWSGSATTYYARYEHPFAELTRHPRLAVRRWAKSMLRRLRASRERARNEEEEEEAWWEVGAVT